MAVIDFQISEHNFELIRDRIGEILATEIITQTGFTDVSVWSERKIPFDRKELPSVNVLYDTTPYDSAHAGSKVGENKFFIYVQYALPSTDDESGDSLGSKKSQRLAGIIDFILSYEKFSTLGFGAGFIFSTLVDEITMGGMDKDDSDHNVACRLQFTVQCEESTDQIQPVNVEGYDTQVKLNLTDFGHKYVLNNN